MKRALSLLAVCLAAALLCSCAANGVPVTDAAPSVTLPPAKTSHVAPIGDAALEYTASATLYLPRHDGTRLYAVSTDVSFSFAKPVAESIVRALCAYPGDGVVSSLGGDVKLSPYGANPVEISRDVATVNLAATALQLDRQSLYIVGQAIANTLCELSDIHYVNLLVMDKPVSLDIAGTLPMGAFSRSVGQDVGAAYEQLLSRRVAATEDASQQRLSSNVTLYFPIAGANGFMSEVRTCSFASQDFSDMVATILREMANGPQAAIQSPALPLLGDILSVPPILRDSNVTGGQIVYLAFGYNLDEMLEAYGLTRAQGLASICYTLCTFLPGVGGVSVSIGETPVTTLMLTEDFESSVEFQEGVERRCDFAPLLYDNCTLYLSDGQRLVATQRPVPYAQRGNPRDLLQELAKGPQSYDSVTGLQPAMPANALADADLLGFAADSGTMLVNFAPSVKALGESIDAQDERLFAFAMVNTLCHDERVQNVCFFLSGSQWQRFSGEIDWSGDFAPMY